MIRGPRGRREKTETAQQALRDTNHLYIGKGQVTPLDFFIACYYSQGRPIVLDDVEQFMSDSGGLERKLVTALGETCDDPRRMCWSSTTPLLGETRKEFLTT